MVTPYKTSPTATAPPYDRQAPFPQPHQSGGLPTSWSSGICDCFSDIPSCCMTCWCPCVTFGQIAEIIDRGSTSCGASGALYCLIGVTGLSCIYSCFYRTKMRSQYRLPETPCPDFLVHFCCEPCTLCQEYRELRDRGFDMSIGWNDNIERQSQGVVMPMSPFVQGGMTR